MADMRTQIRRYGEVKAFPLPQTGTRFQLFIDGMMVEEINLTSPIACDVTYRRIAQMMTKKYSCRLLQMEVKKNATEGVLLVHIVGV